MGPLKVGDVITLRPAFGLDAPTEVTVTSLDITDYPREKYGCAVTSAPWQLVRENRVLIGYGIVGKGDRWAYSEQVVI